MLDRYPLVRVVVRAVVMVRAVTLSSLLWCLPLIESVRFIKYVSINFTLSTGGINGTKASTEALVIRVQRVLAVDTFVKRVFTRPVGTKTRRGLAKEALICHDL